MTHDIVIKGGEVVDGTGTEAVRADVAITGDTITEVGKIDGKAHREIDASGLVVTPGFVDLHTHLDAQIGWDPQMTPVSWHGVTTALMGNCGVTFAPCKPSDAELLASMMETVEDIPKNAILTGLPWDWEGYGGYLDAIERLNPALNVCGLVGHCAVRFYVMGERAVEEQATDDELKQMADVVAQSIDDGAVGFSTNRYEPHKLPDGRSIPGTFADPKELVEIAKAVGVRGALMQAVGARFDVLRAIAATSKGRVLFSYGAGEDGQVQVDRLAKLAEEGDFTAITQVRGSGFMFGLQANLPISGMAWNALREQDLAGRLKTIGDPEAAAKLVQEAKDNEPRFPLDQVFFLGADEVPNYTAGREYNLQVMAQSAGEHWVETFLRLSRETDGKALFNLRLFNQDIDQLAKLIKSEHVFPSLGDAGAHVSQIMDAGWPSFVIKHWIRDTGLYSMGEGIRRLTSGPARVLGLADRGTIAPGKRADVNVLDPAEVAELQPELVHDFPGGAPRFIQKGKGYKTTLVNGTVTLVDGEHVGGRAGRVIRHAS